MANRLFCCLGEFATALRRLTPTPSGWYIISVWIAERQHHCAAGLHSCFLECACPVIVLGVAAKHIAMGALYMRPG